MMLKCRVCSLEKRTLEFTTAGLNTSRCQDCEKEYKLMYYQKNIDLINEKNKQYRTANRELLKCRNKKYCKIKKKKSNAASYLKHKNQRLKQYTEYRLKNKKKIFEINKNYIKNNAKARLRLMLRTRLNQAIKNKSKWGSAVQDLGCTIEFFMNYMENKFKLGMTWKNHSRVGWHIDHITPLSSFDLNDETQFKKAVHYTNLQPLWASENLSKSNKVAK